MDRNVRASSILVRGTKSLNQRIMNPFEKPFWTFAIVCVIAIAMSIAFPSVTLKDVKSTITYDSVNLHIQYKGCVVANKFEEDGTYKLIITNRYWPLKDQYKEITVSQHIYTNLYFIGDTIK